LLPENSGQYRLNLTEGKIRVSKTKGNKTAIYCTISALAALAIGGSRPQKLVSAGEITLGNADLLPILAALFPATNTFVNEYF
jgi:predicted acetyltransferase